jgi:DNA-binding response OmpR family regulator
MLSAAGCTTILIVEDDPILCQILGRVVIGAGRRILLTGNSVEALNLLTECSVELVLLDLGLREGTGLQLAETLRERYPRLSVILLSNHRLGSSVLRGWTARKLTKSVNLPDLRAAVSAALTEVAALHGTETGVCSRANEPSQVASESPVKTSLGLALSTKR